MPGGSPVQEEGRRSGAGGSSPSLCSLFGSADGRTVWVLIRRLNSSCKRSIALVVRRLRHWLRGGRAEGNKRSPASSRVAGAARGLSLHFRVKGLARTRVAPGRRV